MTLNRSSKSVDAAASVTSMLSFALNGDVATITLTRPPVNAIDPDWLARLSEVLTAIERLDAQVIHIRSSERAFCAGVDLNFMRARFSSAAGREEVIDLTCGMQSAYARLEAMGIVSIAEIGGAALGGGFELALACDLRIVADGANLGLPEAQLGLLPAAGGTQRLTRIAGAATARRLILGAEVVDGTSAVALGLAQWAAPTVELEATARNIAQRIAALPKAALAACKASLAAALSPDRDGYAVEIEHSAALLALPVTQQRVRNFLAPKV